MIYLFIYIVVAGFTLGFVAPRKDLDPIDKIGATLLWFMFWSIALGGALYDRSSFWRKR